MPYSKVYLVGSGPGSVDLVTEKAKKLIKEVDIILYDELIGELKEVIEASGVEAIDVGKRAGQHKKKQEETNKLLVEFAKEGKNVLRVKGGDPFVFGRGGEEAEILAENGIYFEIVPGITSPIAAPAYAGIPVTHRKYDPAVVFLTGKEKKEEQRINWEALAKLNATIVILMGMSNLKNNADKLIEYGRNPQTPVAIIEKGCTHEQRVVVGNLSNIAQIAEKEGAKAPAIIVIGEVVNLRAKLSPYLVFD